MFDYNSMMLLSNYIKKSIVSVNHDVERLLNQIGIKKAIKKNQYSEREIRYILELIMAYHKSSNTLEKSEIYASIIDAMDFYKIDEKELVRKALRISYYS